MSSDKETGWHLDKKVPITLILVLTLQGVTGLWFIADMKKDIELLKAAMVEQHLRDERQDRSTADAVSLVRQDIRELSNKLDRLIERKSK